MTVDFFSTPLFLPEINLRLYNLNETAKNSRGKRGSNHMTTVLWEKKLCNLIKKYKPASNDAAFRNEYRDVLSLEEARKKLGSAGIDLLIQARDLIEAWASPNPTDPVVAFEQWQKLYDAGWKAIPAPVLESFLRKLPPATHGVVDWEPFIFSCTDARLIDVLLERRLVREQDLIIMAERKPDTFYRSAALDVMMERKTFRIPRTLWDQCVQRNPRPFGLMTREETLIHCYARTPGEVENERMCQYLLDTPTDREKVFRKLLEHREAALRLCCHLTFGVLNAEMLGRTAALTNVDVLLVIWIVQSQVELEKGDVRTAETAAIIVATARLFSLVRDASASVDKPKELREESARVEQKAVLKALKKLEKGRSSSAAETVWVLLGKELLQVIQDYLKQLHIGTDTGQESPERALRLERYMGSKQVIELVLSAMAESNDEGELRDSLEVALFNCGVRPLGNIGDEVPFDVHSHEAEVPGVLPDDPVIVTCPGRLLGENNEGYVILKAKIRPINHDASAPSSGDSI